MPAQLLIINYQNVMDCSIMKSQEAQHLGKAKYVLKYHFESHHNKKKKDIKNDLSLHYRESIRNCNISYNNCI